MTGTKKEQDRQGLFLLWSFQWRKCNKNVNKYIFLNFQFKSPYDPDIWTHVISRFSGLVLTTIKYNAKAAVWEYEGRIYERKTTL